MKKEKKVRFSEIGRCFGWSIYPKELLGKYYCQVFDENGDCIKVLIGDSYKEVVELQKKFEEEMK